MALLIAAGVLAAAWFGLTLALTPNVPLEDDYHCLLDSTSRYLDAPGPMERIGLIFSQYNEHRVAVVRLLALVSYKLLGQIRFDLLTALGNLFYLALAGLLCLLARDRPALTLLPVLGLMLNLQSRNITWATASLINHGFLLFSVLTIYLAGRGGGLFLLGSIASLFTSVYLQGGGLLAGVMVLALLAYQRRFGHLAFFLAAYLILLIFYFRGFVRTTLYPGLDVLLADPITVAAYTLAFLGGFLRMLNRLGPLRLLPFLAGGLILVWLLLVTFKARYFKASPVLYAVLLFLVLLAPMTASVRMLHGVQQAFAGRYIIYSLTLVSVVFLISLETVPARFKRPLWLTATALILVYSLSTSGPVFRGLRHEARDRVRATRAWAAGERGGRLAHPYPEVAAGIMEEALARGIYRPPRP